MFQITNKLYNQSRKSNFFTFRNRKVNLSLSCNIFRNDDELILRSFVTFNKTHKPIYNDIRLAKELIQETLQYQTYQTGGVYGHGPTAGEYGLPPHHPDISFS